MYNDNVLSVEDLSFWEENGYVVVKNAVPQENLTDVVEAIWAFLEVDPIDNENWYAQSPRCSAYPDSPISQAGMVEIYQHQALWNNRQYPRIHQAFAEIWQTEKSFRRSSLQSAAALFWSGFCGGSDDGSSICR